MIYYFPLANGDRQLEGTTTLGGGIVLDVAVAYTRV